jgi:hypothetical protein
MARVINYYRHSRERGNLVDAGATLEKIPACAGMTESIIGFITPFKF